MNAPRVARGGNMSRDAGRRCGGDRGQHLLPLGRCGDLRLRYRAARRRRSRAGPSAVTVPVAVKLTSHFISSGKTLLVSSRPGPTRSLLQPIPAARRRPRAAGGAVASEPVQPCGRPSGADRDGASSRGGSAPPWPPPRARGGLSHLARYLLAGADVVMTTTALPCHAPGYAAELLRASPPGDCQPAGMMTSRRRGPCTPCTRRSSMSAVADGPEMSVIARPPG